MSINTEPPSKEQSSESALIMSWVLSAYSLGSGIAIIVGGRDRWSAPAYETALQFPGAPASWGWILASAATIVLIGLLIRSETSLFDAKFLHALNALRVVKYIFISWGFRVIGLWNLFFASTFLQQFREGDASLQPVLTYLAIGIFAVLCDNTYGKKTRDAASN